MVKSTGMVKGAEMQKSVCRFTYQFHRMHLMVWLTLVLFVGCGIQNQETVRIKSQSSPTVANVDASRIIQADNEPQNWLVHGRTYGEQRYSPLSQITEDNLDRLGLAWFYDFETKRGMEATPIVVDGVIYVSGSWSRVYALSAKNGELLWEYNPKVPPQWAVNLCCDVVNRGVAVWKGMVYVGTLDGRLIALNAEDGQVVWSVQTTPIDKPYSITGAPRIVKDKVIIGNGGAELGVRGFVSAYDAKTGEMHWRFYTVPGDPKDPFESLALERAAKTWKGGEWWKIGGGGTVWDSMAYDPVLDILYFGVGNGSPWSRYLRSPGGGDNLFLSSIVAVRPDTGEYIWHYQTTPGDSWDYTATQHMILADLKIEGQVRKVIMQAPKNGFFYVLDRETGEFISAKAFVDVNWASHVDAETGRPVIKPEAFYDKTKPFVSMPGPAGGHTWQPMSFNPQTGLVYLPAMSTAYPYQVDSKFEHQSFGWSTGIDDLVAAMPEDEAQRKAIKASLKGRLLAWDPVRQEPKWQVEHANIWNGGVVSTATNLVFQGNGEGFLNAYSADQGKKLWSFFAQTGIMAAPISYAVDGEQYIAVMAGWGGGVPLIIGGMLTDAANQNVSRLLVFKLGGDKQLPPLQVPHKELNPPPMTAPPETVQRGKALYHKYCGACHGNSVISGGILPDLRYTQLHPVWDQIVLDGLLSDRGMVSFRQVLTEQDAAAIQAYVIARAHQDMTNLKTKP
ncbi:MAG: PQQ-dependent dehydrogenase, methanol/ethanol family [Pseudomonadales bacterium]|nr:PQQ-dependent dehydrogenase, methanol/ethanol family [Pseudomonadales bacterium]